MQNIFKFAITLFIVATMCVTMNLLNYITPDIWSEVSSLSIIPGLFSIPVRHLEIMTGNLLGDGHINKRHVTGNGVFMMGQKAACIGYLTWLFNTVYSVYCTSTHKIRQSPSISSGLPVVGYKFDTQSLPIFTLLHALWYREDDAGKYIKGVPSYVYDIFSPLVLAVWFMDDGYYNSNARTFFFCTDSFTLDEVNFLVDCLAKLGIKAAANRYSKGGYRIRVYRSSVDLMRTLMKPHIHPDFEYKTSPRLPI